MKIIGFHKQNLCIFQEKGERVQAEIKAVCGHSNVHLLSCDLSSFESIKSCCAAFKAQFDQLHILINNAGVWDFNRTETVDGIERIFAVNFLAPFLMTHLLLDRLKENAPARIITKDCCHCTL